MRQAISGRIDLAVLSLLLALTIGGAPADAQVPAQPKPPSEAIQARDGDLIVVEGDVRVRIVKRRSAQVRTIYNAAERWLVMMADYSDTPGQSADGGVDVNYTFHDVDGWPLGARWSGAAVLDDYTLAGATATVGVALVTASQTLQLLGTKDSAMFSSPGTAVAVSFRGMGRGGGGNEPFERAELRLTAQASDNARRRAAIPGGAPDSRSSLELRGLPSPRRPSQSPSTAPAPNGPVRVGSTIRQPRKIVDVPPVKPDRAKSARISGMVLLEVTIGADGSVTDAKVLRSIPLLDEAALEAVRQWRYEPTILNGVAVPVIIIVPVSFDQ